MGIVYINPSKKILFIYFRSDKWISLIYLLCQIFFMLKLLILKSFDDFLIDFILTNIILKQVGD